MRPEVALKFDDIMAISAKNRSTDIETLKNRLRDILDYYAETEDTQNDNAELYSKMRGAVAERGPKLV